MPAIFPFTAIVGQEKMKMALILNAISPQIGGVLIRGERGTAKSTAARALAALLPEIEVVANCPFNCDPRHLEVLCDNCRDRVERSEELPVARRRTRFVDLPVSATEDRVVGTLDIELAIKRGERHFEPGVLAAANRGLLYVDEVNLLDDHVVDLLLDSAAMGVNVVEREGISFSHPARFILVGTMNPEEGELRPQLLDRFSLCVEIKGIADPQARVEILERCVQFEQDPEGFREEWEPHEEQLSRGIARARELLPEVRYDPGDLLIIAELMANLSVDGHRPDIVILKAALAHAAFAGRRRINETDILAAAELALPHRLKRQPFEEAELKLQDLKEKLAQASTEQAHQDAPPSLETRNSKPETSTTPDGETPNLTTPLKGHQADPLPLSYIRQADMPVSIGEVFKPRRVDTPLDRLTRNSAGKRSFTRTERKRGRYVQSRPANGQSDDIAFDATLRYAAPHQIHRQSGNLALAIADEDLQRKVRVRRAANLILFVVDASWSMAAAERMVATKGAIMSLLNDAYQRRDQVGLVVFQKDEARLVLPPTSSVELARKALQDIPVGGKTPLSSGLLLAYRVCQRELRRNREVMPLMIVLTDGAGNVSMTDLPAQEEGLKVADFIKRSGIRSVVINMEHTSFDRGLAQDLADALGAPCYTLQELKADELYQTVRGELKGRIP
ncbi:MAG: putative cobaltochelatase [Chloroflexi bacterium]|nr:putative cobaltochelatase [Chloroflexota bacterium]